MLEVMAKEIVDLQYRMGGVEHAAMYAWVLPSTHSLAQMAAEWHKKWNATRLAVTKEMKDRRDGSANIGHVKNYTFMSIVNAYLSATSEQDEGHQYMYKAVAELVGDSRGKIVEKKGKQLDRMVAMCRVKAVKKSEEMIYNTEDSRRARGDTNSVARMT